MTRALLIQLNIRKKKKSPLSKNWLLYSPTNLQHLFHQGCDGLSLRWTVLAHFSVPWISSTPFPWERWSSWSQASDLEEESWELRQEHLHEIIPCVFAGCVLCWKAGHSHGEGEPPGRSHSTGTPPGLYWCSAGRHFAQWTEAQREEVSAEHQYWPHTCWLCSSHRLRGHQFGLSFLHPLDEVTVPLG